MKEKKIIFFTHLPFETILGNDRLNCGLWQCEENVCELRDDSCTKANYYFGTTDNFDPMFCSKHFFELVSGDGETNYTLELTPSF